jgi:hypothetical protein
MLQVCHGHLTAGKKDPNGVEAWQKPRSAGLITAQYMINDVGSAAYILL